MRERLHLSLNRRIIREEAPIRPASRRDSRRAGTVPGALLLAAAIALAASAAGQDAAAPRPATPPPAATPAASRGDLAARLQESVAAAQKVVEEIRRVPFRGPVASALLPEKALRAALSKKLVEDLPTTFEKYEAALVALGLVEPTPDLKSRLTELYAKQVVGFYDPAESKFYVVPERAGNGLAGTDGLGPETAELMEEALLVHELTHALQDQRLGLDKKMKALKDDSDALFALQALLEGEATVVMAEALVRRLPEESRALLSADRLSEMLSSFATGNLNEVEGADGVPEFFVKGLLFPYLEGTKYVQKRREAGAPKPGATTTAGDAKPALGWEGVDELYRRLPKTTSEILHPERSHEPRLLLQAASQPKASDVPAGHRFLFFDSLGEWGLRTLLESAGAAEASSLAAAWRDDRMVFFEPKAGPENAVGFLWRLRAATPEAAKRLAAALAPFYERRGGAAGGRKPPRPRYLVALEGDVVEVKTLSARRASAPKG